MTERDIPEQLENWVTIYGWSVVQGHCKRFLKSRKRKSSISTKRRTVPKSWVPILVSRQDNICVRCGNEFKEGDKIVFDHIIPIVSGGEHSIDNGAALHEKCNLYKGANSIYEESKASGRTIAEILK